MRKPLSFGLQFPSHLPWPETVQNCRRLETMGFDSVWLNDLLMSPMAAGQPWFSAWPALAALAVETNRIRLGTLITTFLLRHPALLAKDVVTVDHISGGRLEVGIGSGGGEAARDLRVLGLPVPEVRGRVRRFREGVALLDSLLRGAAVQATGEHFQGHGMVVSPAPLQPHIPLTIAAEGDVALQVAARYATKWNSFRGEAPGAESREVIATIRERGEKLDDYALQCGRDPGEITRSFLQGWTPDTPWASLSAFEDFVGRYRDAVSRSSSSLTRPSCSPVLPGSRKVQCSPACLTKWRWNSYRACGVSDSAKDHIPPLVTWPAPELSRIAIVEPWPSVCARAHWRSAFRDFSAMHLSHASLQTGKLSPS